MLSNDLSNKQSANYILIASSLQLTELAAVRMAKFKLRWLRHIFILFLHARREADQNSNIVFCA